MIYTMTRTQIQFPEPLYRRLKEVAEMNDWSMSDVVRRASEIYVQRFPEGRDSAEDWTFPTLDVGGDFLTDPADTHAEADAIALRAK